MNNEQQTINNKIVVRIPPSPTGYFHIGRARTALFNYLFAKKNDGKIVLRLEDTDKERCKPEFEEDIIESLKWLGLGFDEGPFKQSERGETYKKYIMKMIDEGTAYVSTETEGVNKEVIRYKNPNKILTFHDVIRGDISFDTTELKDFVIARNIDDPLYHLTVVVDDHEMGITHIIRGDDGISNTPRQILIQEAIGAIRPTYIHVPLILGKDRSKLSGRDGAVSIRDYREKGYLPQAIVNYLALLGWNPGTDQEIFTLEELVKVFDIAQIHKGGAIFDETKLQWVNKEHIKLLSPEEKLKIIARDFDSTTEPKLIKEMIAWKDSTPAKAKKHLSKILDVLDDKEAIMSYAELVGKGSVLWPLRYALSGKEKSPDPFSLLDILGKDESEKRVLRAIEILK